MAISPQPYGPARVQHVTPRAFADRLPTGVDLLSRRWTVEVLSTLREGPVRLGELHRRFPASSKKVLTETLRRLEEHQLLYRLDLSGRIRHVEYHLIPGMRDEVTRILEALDRWSRLCAQWSPETVTPAGRPSEGPTPPVFPQGPSIL